MRALLVLGMLLLASCTRAPAAPEVCQHWCQRYAPTKVIVMEDGRCACIVDPLGTSTQ